MDPIQAAARNLAYWTDRQLRAHGLECRYSDSPWTCLQPGSATDIHWEAISLAPGSAEVNPGIMRDIEGLVAAREGDPLEVCDWWRTLDFTSLGFELGWNSGVEPALCLLRPPGDQHPVAIPPELEIARVRTPETLKEFEEVFHDGYELTGSYKPGRWLVPASLDDPDMRYFIGRANGQAVSTSIGVVSDGVVGILGVGTKPAYRRRGYGTAMTWAALRSAPTLPAVLTPSDIAESLYRKMGFRDFHTFRMWRRQGSN